MDKMREEFEAWYLEHTADLAAEPIGSRACYQQWGAWKAARQPQERGEAVFYYRPRSDGMYEGPIHHSVIEPVRRNSRQWVPLYAHPPADDARVVELEAQLAASNRHGAYLDELTDAQADRIAALESQLAESRERLALAYGLLWHVNAGIDAPWGTPSLTPERAAMESRKILRDMLTNEQRGDGINAARDSMKALATDKEQTK